MNSEMDSTPANNNNETSPSSENTENSNLRPTPPPAAQALPHPRPTPITVTASNDMSNQETDLAAMMSEEEEEVTINTAAAAAAADVAAAPTASSSSSSFNATATATANHITNDASTAGGTSTNATFVAPCATAAAASASVATSPSCSSNQFVTPQKPAENKSILLHLGSASATQPQKKKKRNKSSKCLGNIMHDHDSSSSLSNIKTSLSMTSLPPDEKQESRDGINAKLKVERPYNSLKKNTDRNLTNQLAHMHRAGKSHGSHSTSNNSGGSNKHHRYSWGSGHSSSSLHSSAATLGIGSGKDDFWAAIQTNYNYIMDTNLLDTCKEARCEIEGAASVFDNTTDTCFKMLDDNSRTVGSCEDPKELRKWLRDMEHKLESAPTLSEATMLSCAELQKHLTEHSVLYHEIVSHARIVSACIRAATEKEQQQQQQQQLQLQQQQQIQLHQQQHDSDASLIAEQTNSSLSSTDDTATTSSGIVCCSLESTGKILPISPTGSHLAPNKESHTKKSDSNWDRLQNRYHLLYLKAFEVQLWLDGLLRKRSSSADNLTNEDLDSEDIDDLIDSSDDCLDAGQVDGATEDDLNDLASDLESDIRHNSLSYNDYDLQQQQLHNNSNHRHQQQQLHHHHHQRQRQRSASSDIEENQTINVSSPHQHQAAHHSHLLQSSSRDCIQTKIDCEDEGDDEDEEDDIDEADEIDCPTKHRKQLGYTKLLVTFDRSHSGRSSSAAATPYKTNLSLTDFEADSESSDLETIQQRIRNQRGSAGKGLLTTYKYLIANGSFYPSHLKRYSGNNSKPLCTGGAETTVTEEESSAIVNNPTELESCEIHDMQTKAAAPLTTTTTNTTTVVATDLLVNAMVNDHHQQHEPLKVLHQHQQQQHQHQRLTLVAITQNSMTTGSTATLASSASSGASSASSTTGGGGSNTSSLGGGSGSTTNSTNNSMQHKLSSNEANPPHHHHLQPHAHQSHLVNGVGSGGVSGANGGGGGVVVVAGLPIKQKNIAIISPNNSHNGKTHHHQQQHHHKGSHKSPTVLRKHHEHHHSADISKFNRSNRKSKNCAIFYFKHLDTDNETNYSNSNCGDDVHVGSGADGNEGIVGGGALSSSAASSHASDLLKSADVSSDDEGWLYTSVPQHQQQSSLVGIESLNSNHISRGISASTEFHSYELATTIGSIQSATVSSSTSTAALATIAAVVADASVIIGDDSDKENKEASTTTITKIHLQAATATAATTTFAASTTVIDSDDNAGSPAPGPLNSPSSKERLAGGRAATTSGSSSSSSITSSSYSSNDMLTEATTTTASIKTNATKIRSKTQYHQRNEMELQINNNHGSGNKSPATTMQQQHSVMSGNNNNNNSNCANSPSSISTNSLHHHNHISSSSSCNNNGNGNTAPASSSTSPQHAGNSSFSDDAANGNLEKENIRFYTRADICNINVKPNDNHQHHQHHQHSHHQHQQQQHGNVVNVSPTASLMYAQQLHANVGKRLPPRSPAKSSISQTSTNTSTSTISPTKQGKVSHESIKQLVLEAEHLVRDEALKTPTKQKHSINSGGLVQISSTIKKREVSIMPGPIKRVQEWLEHQPSTPVQLKTSHTNNSNNNNNNTNSNNNNNNHHDQLLSPTSTMPSPSRTDDCEASGEASETDSIPQHCSDDTSEGFTDSIATCMQTSTNSYGNSTERMGGSAEPIVVATSNQSLNVKVVKRQQTRRKSERPWSVSCLSQLTTDAKQVAAKVSTISNVQSGLASHSISESALDSLSPGRPRTSSTAAQVKSYDSKGSLKRRKTRKKKHNYANGKKSDTNSEDNHQHHHTELNKHPQTLIMQSCESMTPQQIQEITQALMQLQSSGGVIASEQLPNCPPGTAVTAVGAVASLATSESGEEENHLMKPNFRVGSFTTAYMTNEARLGSLAKLATYMNDEEQQNGEYTTGTEDHHSSFSETAWDNYQEKYNSENYSEGFDSDAARKLLEFGDDYRNFIDSQSDCCSSLSAANNLDSYSPPRMDSLQQNESKIVITQDTIVSSVDHARRRRALELEYERRRKNLEIRRKSCQESLEYQNPKTPTVTLSSSTQALTPKNPPERFHFQHHKLDSAIRKLEFGMSHSAQSLRRTSESDTSQRRRKADERRRSSRNLEKCIKLIPATSSSSGDDTDDEKEIRNLLQQSHNRLDDTRALKIRCHLLRPEDYTEIINTCRDNIRCLESVLKGPSSSVLSSQCVTQSKDLLAAWEDLLGWSENAAAARKMQEDMIVLKHALTRLGNKSSFELLDTEPSIQIAIEALKNEKTQLQTYRTNMLKLNASVHSWLTKQERRLQNTLVEQQLKEAAAKVSIELLEEKDEIESEHNRQTAIAAATGTSTSAKQAQQEPDSTTTSSKTTMITVTDSNGNQVESHTTTTTATTSTNVGTCTTTQTMATTTPSAGEKNWDLQSLITSENEFHKHLKDEVSDMYTAWDEADLRINTQLEVLTSSLIAWRQLECGLSEFQLALGQDRGTLKGLEGALNTGHATPGELAQNVKLVAKLLSEKVNVSQEQLTAVQDYLDPNHILHIAKFTASNGSLSDSGISDGGTTSDGGLSERERRLGVLRRLAKQLESALAPGSEAMKSIAARMESAEADLKSLQNTCRDLIVRTAASHQNKKQQLQEQSGDRKDDADAVRARQLQHSNGCILVQQLTNGKVKHEGEQLGHQVAVEGQTSSSTGRRKRKPRRSSNHGTNNAVISADMSQSNALQMTTTAADGDDDPSDDPTGYDLDSSDDELTPKSKRGWAWRIARVAVPMQLALFTVFCAACLMQPNCCDNINNLSMSFTPQLRYIRGPPPI